MKGGLIRENNFAREEVNWRQGGKEIKDYLTLSTPAKMSSFQVVGVGGEFGHPTGTTVDGLPHLKKRCKMQVSDVKKVWQVFW